ncbi:MAG: hypothetical protein V2J08_05635, partial [Desulfotignum sp.]|nr:hypothetical protein [Desulfotignum sp.]
KMVTPRTKLQDVSDLHQVETSHKNIFDMKTQGQNQTDRTSGRADAASTGFSEKNARNEADRCLQCGLICYEKTAGNS